MKEYSSDQNAAVHRVQVVVKDLLSFLCSTRTRHSCVIKEERRFHLACGVAFTFFDNLHKHWVVTADSEPKAVFIFLDYYTSLDQTCQ